MRQIFMNNDVVVIQKNDLVYPNEFTISSSRGISRLFIRKRTYYEKTMEPIQRHHKTKNLLDNVDLNRL